ncbi:hypothetical protein [Bradyrhizobium sp.]|uniref:hypothetical protein n=1 Tax=Bradyrhizobium sp. TaxID=376 RepID=UPI003C708605
MPEQCADDQGIPKGSWRLLREAILVGEFPRARAAELTGYQDRQARTVPSELIAKGVLVFDTPKGAVRPGFPSTVIERWFPGLYQPRPMVAAASHGYKVHFKGFEQEYLAHG